MVNNTKTAGNLREKLDKYFNDLTDVETETLLKMSMICLGMKNEEMEGGKYTNGDMLESMGNATLCLYILERLEQ